MLNMSRTAGTAAAVLALMAASAPAALATGKAAGGAAAGGGTVAAGGGGGGGGGGTVVTGGAHRGGVVDPPPPGPPCATLSSTSAPVGYYTTFAALWHDFSFRSCNAGAENITVRVTDTNRATGQVEYINSVVYAMAPNATMTGVIDNDFAPFNVDYDVKTELVDATGAVLDTSTTVATTPPPQ